MRLHGCCDQALLKAQHVSSFASRSLVSPTCAILTPAHWAVLHMQAHMSIEGTCHNNCMPVNEHLSEACVMHTLDEASGVGANSINPVAGSSTLGGEHCTLGLSRQSNSMLRTLSDCQVPRQRAPPRSSALQPSLPCGGSPASSGALELPLFVQAFPSYCTAATVVGAIVPQLPPVEAASKEVEAQQNNPSVLTMDAAQDTEVGCMRNIVQVGLF